ncbi:hypothetical protein [Tahibacter harae]|uniref:GIY-YIG domain-containing protein n=1 Tax=Tahibacter harae TaxID=2963937 RepID=A0ABT1QVT6_9GAMM|nr:hypothetical protein [Tahibacter harae]MCQ4166393.1 hypothetical protein [Tahibacter harae]
MNIVGQWHSPMLLKRRTGTSQYTTDLENIPKGPGVYVFTRKFGENYSVIYVGKAMNLFNRIAGQLNNNKLMTDLLQQKENAKAKNGGRFLLFCEIKPKSGQDKQKITALVEKALIQQFLLDGHPLVNIKSARRPSHSISFRGNQSSKNLSGKELVIHA